MQHRLCKKYDLKWPSNSVQDIIMWTWIFFERSPNQWYRISAHLFACCRQKLTSGWDMLKNLKKQCSPEAWVDCFIKHLKPQNHIGFFRVVVIFQLLDFLKTLFGKFCFQVHSVWLSHWKTSRLKAESWSVLAGQVEGRLRAGWGQVEGRLRGFPCPRYPSSS